MVQLSSVLTLLTTLLLPATNVAAEFCYPKNGIGHKWCFDGTPATPCCGVGPCNIFCSDCEGGCRKSRGTSLSSSAAVPQLLDVEAFARAIDIDTAELTLSQYTQYMGVPADDPVYVDWFRRNGDGVITIDELRLDEDAEL